MSEQQQGQQSQQKASSYNQYGERQSLFQTEAGSNFLAAERTAKAETGSDEGLWGPHVREGIKKDEGAGSLGGGGGGDIGIAGTSMAGMSRDDRPSTFRTEGGSNFLTAVRTAAMEGKDASAIWGPQVYHQGKPEGEQQQQQQQARAWK